jgi:hypothetical protein
MNSTRRILVALGAASLVLAGCSKISPLAPPALKSGSASFGTYVAMGTSISSGYESGGLVDRHQTQSFPYLFARQVGSPFSIPSINNDGIPPLLQLVSLSPLVISNAGRTLGNPTNFGLAGAYNNMAIPGAILADVTDSVYYDVPTAVHPNTTMFDIIQRNHGNIIAQVASRNPTFISFEYGANEVLGPASQGSGVPGLTAAQFGGLLDATLTGLQALCPNAKIAIVNVPDVTAIPYVTTFPPYVLNADGTPVIVGGAPLTLIGTEGGVVGPLSPSDYVLLTASNALAAGDGFPIGTFSYLTGAPGTGNPLPNSMVLSSIEATAISATLNGYNTAIADEAALRGMALVDLHGLLQQAATTGVTYQGSLYTSEFVTGGLFSLDGVHPTDLAHGLICNVMIDAVNQTYGSNIQHVNLAQSATPNASRVQRLAGGRVMPDIRGSDRLFETTFPWRERPAALSRR